jgi:hypothetical protein
MQIENTDIQAQKNKYCLTFLGNILYVVASLVSGLWILGAFFYLGLVASWIQLVLAAICLAGLIIAFIKLKKLSFLALLVALIISVHLLAHLDPPRNDRDWGADQEFIPEIEIQGNQVTIKNFRYCRYRSTTDYDVSWETRTYDLDKLIGVDFVVEPFSSWRGLAHTFLTFSFSDGDYVSISVEIRKEKGEIYSPLSALYWNFELTYVIGDERDPIGLRANIRKDPVHLYPIKARKDQVQKLFLSMLKRANKLSQKPEYYDSLFNTCTTNISRHLFENFNLDLGFDIRILFPGYSDAIAFELGLIDTDKALAEARDLYLINKRSYFGAKRNAWSKQIRNIQNTKNNRKTATFLVFLNLI